MSRKTSRNSTAAARGKIYDSSKKKRNIRNILSSRRGGRWFFMRGPFFSRHEAPFNFILIRKKWILSVTCVTAGWRAPGNPRRFARERHGRKYLHNLLARASGNTRGQISGTSKYLKPRAQLARESPLLLWSETPPAVSFVISVYEKAILPTFCMKYRGNTFLT